MSSASPWQRPFPPTRCDVAVVGGGVIGASTAYWLCRAEPRLRVALLEAEALAHGASGRNAGFLIPGTHRAPASSVEALGMDVTRRVLRFTLENVDLVRALGGEHFELRLTGSLIAAGTEAEAERLRASCDWLTGEGLRCRYLDAEEACRATAGKRFTGGLRLEEGGSLNPVKLVRHLGAASGAAILEHWPVTGLDAAGEGVRLDSPRGAITAERVVLCLNAFLPRLIPAAARLVRPVRAQMLATAPVAPFLEIPVYSHDGFYYLRQTADGRLLLGGARHLHEADEVGYDTAPTPAVQASLEAYLEEHFPHLGPVPVERRWSGTMGFSPDGLPVADRLDGLENVFFACGFTGHGMSYGVRFGRLMARMVLGEKDEAAAVFGLERLEALGAACRSLDTSKGCRA